MKIVSYVVIALLLITTAAITIVQPPAAAEERQQTAVAEETQQTGLTEMKDRVSYAIGLNMGQNMKMFDLDIDLDIVIQGIKHGLEGTEPLMSEEQIQQTMNAFQQEMTAKQQAEMARAGEENKKAGDEFRADFIKDKDVKVTESGLAYKVITAGDGPSPTNEDEVVVHYTGKLVNGDIFDSSVQRGEPATFPVEGVIPGFSEALKLMKVGDKWQIVIPPELAYDQQGPGGPNSTLIFELELIGIE